MYSLKGLLRTTPKYVKLLEQSGIVTPKDFLSYFPRAYEDREDIKLLRDLDCDGKVTQATKGRIIEKNVLPRGNKKLYEIVFEDETGAKGYGTYFNSYFRFKDIQKDAWYIVVGKPTFKFGKIQMSHPDFIKSEDSSDTPTNHQTDRIYPIYSEIMGIKPSRFAKNTWKLMPLVKDIFYEYLPEEFLEKFSLMNVVDTVQNMHYPKSTTLQQKAIRRIFFDRLLRIQLHALRQKQDYESGHIVEENLGSPNWELIKEIVAALPFQLTGAQKKVIKQIIDDIHSPDAMLRLLQGDVGSGKTVVAAIAAYYVIKKFSAQAVFLAPLEVLAQQHYKSLAKLLLPLGIRLELLTGSLTAGQKKKIKADLLAGHIHILVGTHAILQEDVAFHDLQFVVIDEQHKFGVQQRSFFKRFGAPHILQMSATPIPRSMALAFFGEFTVSVIDEMPAGRKPIHTKIVSERERHKLKPWILEKISQGQKVFLVTPLVEESEKLDDVASATEVFHETMDMFAEIRGKIGLMHGKLRAKDKNDVMQAFKDGKIMLLVSTTVIEVGVDIPEATIMVIKNAERFGLSQLHQLRGRIGRNDMQSYCFLETKKKSGDTYQRLKAMEDTNDGFKLAEIDLQYRGAGEILGTRQSGETDIPLDILSDIAFLEQVQDGAQWILEHYPDLEGLPGLKDFVEEKMGNVLV